jgi:ABC-type protease/lipase transport system fused ATPase/permease subunit
LSVVDLLLVMRAGQAHSFGPRDDVLARLQPQPAPAPEGAPAKGNLVQIKKA